MTTDNAKALAEECKRLAVRYAASRAGQAMAETEGANTPAIGDAVKQCHADLFAGIDRLAALSTVEAAPPDSGSVDPAVPPLKLHAAEAGSSGAVRAGYDKFNALLRDYLDNYELTDGDNGYHSPSEFEGLLIEDAIQGLFADEEMLGAITDWQLACRATGRTHEGAVPAAEALGQDEKENT